MGDTGSTGTPVRVNRVDIPVPLVLREHGKALRIFVHPDVPMRNHFISKLDVSHTLSAVSHLRRVKSVSSWKSTDISHNVSRNYPLGPHTSCSTSSRLIRDLRCSLQSNNVVSSNIEVIDVFYADIGFRNVSVSRAWLNLDSGIYPVGTVTLQGEEA